ncbi:MAG: (2Fe-2S)-binding protein [Rhodoferax sp.]|nr:(2Fe-2S)-binding protein [Rhodoferax sp.]
MSCACHRVSDKEIAELASQGMGFDEVQFELGVATQCGRCAECAHDVIARCHAQSAMAPAGWAPVQDFRQGRLNLVTCFFDTH